LQNGAQPEKTDTEEKPVVGEAVSELKEVINEQPSLENTQFEPLPLDHAPAPLAWRHVLFRASANSLYLTSTMLISMLIYGLLVIFLVPVEWLEESNWPVFESISALLYLTFVSLLFFPVSLVFQLLIAGMLKDFRRYKWQTELIGLSIAILFCICFFWPGYFL
jgi:hypothetical protein